uniref:Activin_recp domain-containing protein n=1 Tax=Parastrongyloides trichosuri TaxID=131310 RepID=A0A0N4ZXY7_PARTI
MISFIRLVVLLLLFVYSIISLNCKHGHDDTITSDINNVYCGKHVKFCIIIYGTYSNSKIINRNKYREELYFDCDSEMYCKKNGYLKYKDSLYTANIYCCNKDYCNNERAIEW